MNTDNIELLFIKMRAMLAKDAPNVNLEWLDDVEYDMNYDAINNKKLNVDGMRGFFRGLSACGEDVYIDELDSLIQKYLKLDI